MHSIAIYTLPWSLFGAVNGVRMDAVLFSTFGIERSPQPIPLGNLAPRIYCTTVLVHGHIVF